jgi:hypothetical protein
MGSTINFGGGFTCEVRTATVETFFRHLEPLAAHDSEVASLKARQSVFDATGLWSFATLSARALRMVRDVAQSVAADPESASPEWNPTWRPIFVSDVDQILAKLNMRIDQLELS